MAAAQVADTSAQTRNVKADATGCCIAGGGPAGAMLALLLARRGVRVTLLEMHHDFDREFRGDTVHPSTLEILDQLGLAERVHELRSSKISAPILLTKPLLAGQVTTDQLRAIQRKREWPVRIIQAFQTQLQKRVVATALRAQEQRTLHIPWFIRVFTRIPFLRDIPPRMMALGVARVRVEN